MSPRPHLPPRITAGTGTPTGRCSEARASIRSGQSSRTFAPRSCSYGDLLADVDAGGGEDEAPDSDVPADADGDGDARTDGEAVAVGDWYVPVNDGALAEYDTPWEADGLADAPEELSTADVAAAGKDVCAADWSLTGAGRLPDERGQGESSRAGYHLKRPDDPRQHHRPPQAAPRPVRSGRRGLTTLVRRRRHAPRRRRHASRGGGQRVGDDGQGSDWPGSLARRNRPPWSVPAGRKLTPRRARRPRHRPGVRRA